MMKFTLAMLVAAVSADSTGFLQVKKVTKGANDDDFNYGEDGAETGVFEDSPTLGVHEFLEAESEAEVDEEDAHEPGLALSAANDEQTNFGADNVEETIEEEDAPSENEEDADMADDE